MCTQKFGNPVRSYLLWVKSFRKFVVFSPRKCQDCKNVHTYSYSIYRWMIKPGWQGQMPLKLRRMDLDSVLEILTLLSKPHKLWYSALNFRKQMMKYFQNP